MDQQWEILYWDDNDDNPVGKWLDDLTKEQYKCVAKELFLLKKCGNLLRIPHSKPLDDGLFELEKCILDLEFITPFLKEESLSYFKVEIKTHKVEI